MGIEEIYEDQRAFNQLIWDPANRSGKELLDRLKHLCIGMQEETVEFLKTFNYKSHRKITRRQNLAHSHEELIDMFKYWLSLAEAAEFPIEKLEELYYAKSQVCQYRFQSEWVKEIDRSCVVIDIDNVLGDYVSAMCDWILEHFWASSNSNLGDRVQEIKNKQLWINHETLGISYNEWQSIKHDFRTTGGKRHLNIYPDSKSFLQWCRNRGWIIILITSRPIDKYPNLFSDTINWLVDKKLTFDHLWWASEKADRIEESNILKHVLFAVDDSIKFCNQFASKGITTFLLDRSPNPHPQSVHSLDDVREVYTKWQQTMQTQNTDPMPSTLANLLGMKSPTDQRASTSG
jgi:hypothetical protein